MPFGNITLSVNVTLCY